MTLRQIVTAPGRYRHSLGFGIHSPFAFGFVTTVLRDLRSAYYDYPAVDRLSREAGIKERVGRLIYRVGVHFQPHAVAAGCPESVAEIVRLASPGAHVDPFPPTAQTDFVVATPVVASFADEIARDIADVARRGGVALFLGIDSDAALGRVWREVNGTLDRGMTFTDHHLGIIVGRRHLPRQTFGVWL